jgi:hypothetical protein
MTTILNKAKTNKHILVFSYIQGIDGIGLSTNIVRMRWINTIVPHNNMVVLIKLQIL